MKIIVETCLDKSSTFESMKIKRKPSGNRVHDLFALVAAKTLPHCAAKTLFVANFVFSMLFIFNLILFAFGKQHKS
jgi:hypothetical protein